MQRSTIKKSKELSESMFENLCEEFHDLYWFILNEKDNGTIVERLLSIGKEITPNANSVESILKKIEFSLNDLDSYVWE